MADAAFTTALQKATSSTLSLIELIEAASALSRAGQPALARQLYKVWIGFNQADPQRFIAHFNCAALEGDAGEISEAIVSLKHAIALKPDFIQAHINLGRMMERAGAPDQAVEIWRAIANKPMPITGDAVHLVSTAMKQMARVLSDHHKIESAEIVTQRCLEINPSQSDIVEQYVAARLTQCKWPVVVPSERIDHKTLLRGMHPLSVAIYTDDPVFQLAAAERYSRTASFEGPHDPSLSRRNTKIPLGRRRMRIGYVSSDLRDHAIGNLIVEVFELHDKSNVEVFAYYTGGESKSWLTERVKRASEHWRDISHVGDDQAARTIVGDEIDILVDVNGHTRSARTGLFARRPAPIQVNWLGYPGSMGTPYHHYIIADDWIIPPDSEIYYSEKVVRLPCYQPNDRKRIIIDNQPQRADAGLPETGFVFCCFNGSQKITRFTYERWMQILSRAPNSVLWLLAPGEETKARLRKHAEASGVSGERIVFAPRLSNPEHLARYALADLFLDTAPYGAHTTASDALWMGLPVLTLSGRSFASRVCGSLARSAGLADLVVRDPGDYVERAVTLGNDRAAAERYKEKLRALRPSCDLFNIELLVERLEELYLKMADAYVRGDLPQPDLTNLPAYHEAAIEHDHEANETPSATGYEASYKSRLAKLHLARPLHADTRLWTAAEIADTDSNANRPIEDARNERAIATAVHLDWRKAASQ